MSTTKTPALWLGHPRGLATLFFTEMWERFSYYGMRAILVLAMIAALNGNNPGLGISRENANAIYGIYTAAVYLASLPGGWIADRLIGQQRAVFWGGVIIACGHFTMVLATPVSFFVGLVLIALGTGLLKPNISALVGQLYKDDLGARRDAGFSIFYMSINIGSFFGQILCGYLGEKIGWHYGFAAAGFFMVLGLIQYRLFSGTLQEAGLYPQTSGNLKQDQSAQRRGWMIVIGCALALIAVICAVASGYLVINPIAFSKVTGVVIVTLAACYFTYVIFFAGLTRVDQQKVAAIAVFFVAAAMFWSGFEQAGSSFNLFAQEHTDRMIGNWEMPASWLQSVNPLQIIILAPFFAALWVNLGKRSLNPALPVKFALGLLQMAIGFAILAFAARYVVLGQKVAPAWLILTYLFHTTGELCISPVGLSAVTKLAPKGYVGQMLGTWFTASALGHLIAGLLAGQLTDSNAVAQMPDRFMFVCFTTAGTGLLMLLIAKPVTRLLGDVK